MKTLELNLINTKQASKYLGLAEQTLVGWRMNIKGPPKGPPFVKLGDKSIRYRLTDLDKWIADSEVAR